MIGSFRQSMTWLHTWSGLVFSWILYFMFLTGTLGYFDTEIDHWMQPEQARAQDVSLERNLDAGLAWLQERADGADRWFIAPPGAREEPQLRVFWQGPAPEQEGEERQTGNERLDVRTGEPLTDNGRATGGGQVLYRMHYLLHYFDNQTGFRIAAIFTLLMFLAMVTGIVAHKRIFKDFFTFRPSKGQRSWLDMHNLLSVSSLPFLLMITYSGLVFTVALWMPGIAIGSYGFDTQKAAAELGNLLDVQVERAGAPAVLTDVKAVVTDAEAHWGAGQVRGVDVRVPGDANARIIVNSVSGVGAISERRVYDGVNGRSIETIMIPGGSVAVAAVLIGLHEGLFAGPFLRWLYFLAGLLGTAMVATGAIYWTAKRRKEAPDKEQSRGFRFVECLNIGTIVGLPVAIAAYFWANRLLPLGFEGRAEWEVHCLFIVWALCLLYPLARPRLAAWRELAWVAAMAYAAIPFLNAITTDVHLVNSIAGGDWVMASFDLSALAFGIVFAVVAAVVGRKRLSDQKTDIKTGNEVAVS